jgi:hypothetical protein
VTEQLSFDLSATAEGNGHDPEAQLRAQIRELVVEDGMTEDEIEALIDDVLDQLRGRRWPRPADTCRCTHRLVLPHDRGDSPRCHWCGRVP